MKHLRNAFTVLLIISALCLEQIVTACAGGEDPYDYYTSFFQNNITGSTAYSMFYYTSGLQYYDQWGGIDEDDTKQEDANLEEWLAYGQQKFTETDAAAFIYKYSYKDLNNLYYHIEQQKPLQLPDSVGRNSMTKWFLQDKDLEALGYLMYAKKCEVHSGAGTQGQWETAPKDIPSMNKLQQGGKQLWKAAKKDFFQWRYAYQVMRLAFYSNDYKGTKALFTELVGDKTSGNIMYNRCLGLKAGAFYQTGDYNFAAYLYSIAFNATDDNKPSNYISYDWCFQAHGEGANARKADRAAVDKLTHNNDEKAVLLVMDALHEYENGLPLLEKAYELAPGVSGLDIVMTREINKAEQNYFNYTLSSNSGFNDNNTYGYRYTYSSYSGNYAKEAAKSATDARARMQELMRFGERVYNEGKTRESQSGYWPLAVAYLHYMNQDWANCSEWIAKAEKQNPNGKIKDMLLLEKLLLAINRKQTLDAATEQEILPSVQWLESKAKKQNRYAAAYRNLMTTVLPNAYMKQRDTTKALLCIARGTTGPEGTGSYNYYQENPKSPVFVDPGYSSEMDQVSTPGILAMKDWVKSSKKSAFESWLVKYPPYKDGALELYVGTRYLRHYEFDKAEAVLKNVSKSLLAEYAFADPFAEYWVDTQEPADTSRPSDKYAFAREMNRMQNGIDKADAATLYRYANGLYSMTYYGLCWQAGMYGRSGSDDDAYYADTSRNSLIDDYRRYYTAEMPMKYYQLAFDKSKDNELKAKCLFMLSKCWQKSAESEKDYHFDPTENTDYVKYTLKSPYFRQLKNQYAGTAAYKELMQDCTYLQYFVRKTDK